MTIAKEVDVDERNENLGAQVLREAAERTADAVVPEREERTPEPAMM